MGFKLVFIICRAFSVNGTLKAHMELFKEPWFKRVCDACSTNAVEPATIVKMWWSRLVIQVRAAGGTADMGATVTGQCPRFLLKRVKYVSCIEKSVT